MQGKISQFYTDTHNDTQTHIACNQVSPQKNEIENEDNLKNEDDPKNEDDFKIKNDRNRLK